jgi:hypothetical protein
MSQPGDPFGVRCAGGTGVGLDRPTRLPSVVVSDLPQLGVRKPQV